ncbi:MAG: four helix bundle protein [Phycisphaerae bacterium]|nr:four helix bundle protein [Phycisphaerae bacterium]
MMAGKSYCDMLIWQKSMALVTALYELTKTFPQDEKFGLTSQMRRAAVSIPSNIAEGYGRCSQNEFDRFLHIALSSLFELETQLQIACNLNYIDVDKTEEFYLLCNELERMLNSFIRTVQSKKR